MTKEIVLTNGKERVLVDDSDYEWLIQYPWRMAGKGADYPSTSIYNSKTKKPTTVSMSRIIMGAETGDGKIVDHINRNKLDNRRCNLRFVSISQSLRNRGGYGKSKYKGVYKTRNRWRAVLHIGTFDTPEEARDAFARAWSLVIDKDDNLRMQQAP